MVEESEARWLLLIHQIPPQPGYLRVKIRRRLQQLGAVPIKQTVYALPRSAQAQEDFEWLRGEIVAGGGEAFICGAGFLGGVTDAEVEGLFVAAREQDYLAIDEDAQALRDAVSTGDRGEALGHIRKLRRRLTDVAAIDFFGAPGRPRVESLLAELETLETDSGRTAVGGAKVGSPEKVEDYRGRTWVTREGVFVDRMASAWLIRRFIDPAASFRFVAGRQYLPEQGEVRFDMFEAELTHEGERCTFETLVERFGLEQPGLRAFAEVVHDLDFKDAKFGRPETAGIGSLLTGIASAREEDHARLDRSAELFEDLYVYFSTQETLPSGERKRARGAQKKVEP